MWPIPDSIRAGRWQKQPQSKNTMEFCVQVLLHDPSEFPEVNKKGIFIGSGQEASIAIDAEVSTSGLFQALNSGILRQSKS